jgi:hypothetical protein
MGPKSVMVVVEKFCEFLCGYIFDRHRISFLNQSIVRSAPSVEEQSEFKTLSGHWLLSLLPTGDLLFDMAESDTGPVTASKRSALLAHLYKEPQIERDHINVIAVVTNISASDPESCSLRNCPESLSHSIGYEKS